jgi:galactose oxidase-like protein
MAAHGQAVLFGCNNGTGLNDTWVWDGTNWTQQSPATSPSARTSAMAFGSGHDQVVLFGGANSTTAFSDTWLWNGGNWTQQSPGTIPIGV